MTDTETVRELREGLIDVRIQDSINVKDLQEDSQVLGVYTDLETDEKRAIVDISQFVNSKIEYIH